MAVKPNLALIPSGVKASKVYSVLPTDGTGDFDFSRSGSATRINKDGLIEEVGTGIPRLNYPLIEGEVSGCPSLLLEPSRTNLIPFSEDFSNAAWQKISTGIDTSIGTNGINPNVAISPDGTLNADRVNFILQSDLDTGLFDIFAASQNNTYSASVFLKGEGSNIGKEISIRIKRLSGGTFTSVDTKYTLTDKWVRLKIDPLTMPSGSTNGIISFTSSEATNCLIYGCQVEQGSYPTSYIPNYGTGSGVTRSAETCNNAGDVNTFNDSEGVLFGEISALNNTVDGYKTINIGSNSADNRLGFGFDDQSRIYGFKRTNTSWNIPIEANINEFNKVAISYDTNNNHFWLNGFKVGSNTTIGDITQPIELDFRASYGGEQFNGSTKQIQYFDTALTDTDLEELTSWTSFNEMANSQLYSVY